MFCKKTPALSGSAHRYVSGVWHLVSVLVAAAVVSAMMDL